MLQILMNITVCAVTVVMITVAAKTPSSVWPKSFSHLMHNLHVLGCHHTLSSYLLAPYDEVDRVLDSKLLQTKPGARKTLICTEMQHKKVLVLVSND